MNAYPKPERRATGSVPAATMAALRGRSGGKCEACHMARATEAHHRKYKGRGGTHAIENLLHLCNGGGPGFGGNHSGCHGIAHTGPGQERGLSVASHDDPVDITYRDDAGVEFQLFADGTKQEVQTMIRTIPSDQAEGFVGAERLEFVHVGLASSSDERVYVLHSARCLRIRQELREELTECVFSTALENGIDLAAWRGFEDTPVSLSILNGQLFPVTAVERKPKVETPHA